MRAVLSLLVMGVLTGLMLLLIAGHGPWAGRVLWDISPNHGINSGDIPVFGLWTIGMVGLLLLGRSDD